MIDRCSHLCIFSFPVPRNEEITLDNEEDLQNDNGEEGEGVVKGGRRNEGVNLEKETRKDKLCHSDELSFAEGKQSKKGVMFVLERS